MGILHSNGIKWDLVGCLGLDIKKNEKKRKKKTIPVLQKGALQKNKRVMWVVGLTDNLILWVVGLSSN